MSQRDRYDFLVIRDGRDLARAFMLENVVRTYRKFLLKSRGMMHRKGLIRAYLEAKQILAES